MGTRNAGGVLLASLLTHYTVRVRCFCAFLSGPSIPKISEQVELWFSLLRVLSPLNLAPSGDTPGMPNGFG